MKLRAFVSAGWIVLAAQLIGCGSPDDGGGAVAGTRISQVAAQSGCRTVCATCAPGQICPHNCRLECPAGVVPCGDVLCRGNDVCCNETCSVCAHPGGTCPQNACAPRHPCVDTELCIRGFHWSPQLCVCVPDVPGTTQEQCATDADCRSFSDYCGGCNCRALLTTEPNPACPGADVQCVADPCASETAICVDGRCMLTPNASPARHSRPPRAPHSPHHPAGPQHPTH